MRTRHDIQKTEKIDAAAALLRERLPAAKAGVAERFLRQFYANVAPQDLAQAEVENLFGAAVSMWAFGRERTPGVPKVRAYNPRFEAVGWQSPHTVIEIVNDDMPFLVDSVTAALNRKELTVHLVIHPILRVVRDAKGIVTGLAESEVADKEATAESFMQLMVSEQSSVEALEEIEATLLAVLADVRAAVEDWRAMRQTMLDVVAGVEAAPPETMAPEDVAEVCAFLRWIEDNHYTFLGYRRYDYVGSGAKARMNVVDGSGLGILRSPDVHVFDGMRDLGALPADVRGFVMAPTLLLIMKANKSSTVHRPVPLDSIGIKVIRGGKVVGEHRFIGLFTSVAYNESPKEIPLLRQRVAKLVARAGFRPASHDGKALVNILETFPRDELFQASEDELFDIAIGVLHLQERQKTAVFVRKDAFERFVSALVYVPRDHFNTQLRVTFQGILERAFNGRVAAFYTQMSESVLARLHFIINTTRGQVPEVDVDDLLGRLVEAGRSWSDKLHDALVESRGEEAANLLFRRYGQAFPSSYREANTAHAAIYDIDRIEELGPDRDLGMNLFRPAGSDDDVLHLKLFHAGSPVPLSDVMPMLENMGVRVLSEVPYEVAVGPSGEAVWIHDFAMRMRDGGKVDLGEIKQPFQEAFAAVWGRRMENDGFNGLVLGAGLNWREVTVLRAYAKYLRQAAFTFSQDYMEETLRRYPKIARRLARLFVARFDPDAGADQRAARCLELTGTIEGDLERVVNLDQDRILRRFLNLIQSSLRTNYFQAGTDGGPKDYLSIKLDSRAVDELPLPRPLVEIWVYSPRVEAVHLRGGKVARGGIRWSDRREDFRTEILGLMKAQQVKNAVIVPVGSKGGFVVKRPPASGARDEVQAEGIECYKTLMRGMLDITDNIRGADVVPPPRVVRYDDDDPYLVVAADKGTATFSDIANGVSQSYGFWLDDAFASGGSAGYDHKKMGITARGAWESVKRHFREIGHDIQAQDFSVVGVGDMSGDVFGNGMLLSRHIRLLGAFNHLHVFVDPDPDPAASWQERKRLFDLPRSSWADYDAKLISRGGGVFERSAKSIRLTPEIKALFGLSADTVTPNDLIRAILCAPVDLLFFGGIGTYVKATRESAAEVGDRANDGVRIDAAQIRAKVVGEGANLGVTQRGRIEFGLRGGRINTDAIDNSAGVDCSDHEVNIKILLGAVVAAGDMTLKQRDALLEAMTDEVAQLVLRDNYEQTQALSAATSRGAAMLDAQARLIRELERGHLKLNRAIEFLPDDETLAERAAANVGLTRPELAVLLAYAKMALYDELLDSDLPDDPQLVADLALYFPERLRSRHPDALAQHRLRREIIATSVTNSMINRVGAAFVNAMHEQTGAVPSDIARAYAIVRDVFGLRALWDGIESLDNRVSAALQTSMLLEIQGLVERLTFWFLRNGRQPLDIARHVAEFGPGVAELKACLPEVLGPLDRQHLAEQARRFAEQGVPAELAQAVASLDVLAAACDVVRLAAAAGQPVGRVATVYFGVGARFALDWLRERAGGLAATTHWQKLAVGALIDDFYGHQSVLAQDVLAHAGDGGGKRRADGADAAIAGWAATRPDGVERTDSVLADIRAADQVDLAMLAVANGQIRTLLAR